MEQTTLAKVIVPAALFTIMVGLGLSLTTKDFLRIIHSRKAIVVGIIGQMVLLPTLGYIIVVIFRFDSVFGLGLMVLTLCPGGALSNAISYLAWADLALSVTLTAITSLVTPLTMPLVYGWVASSLAGESEIFALPIGKTMLRLFMISIVPIGVGMAIRKGAPTFAARADKPVRVLSLVFFLMVIIGVIKQNWDVFPVGFRTVGPAVLILNLSSLALGFFGARLARLEVKQAVTIGIEVGMQNVATATFVTATLLGDVTMAISPAIYATVMVPSALMFGIGLSRMLLRPSAVSAQPGQ